MAAQHRPEPARHFSAAASTGIGMSFVGRSNEHVPMYTGDSADVLHPTPSYDAILLYCGIIVPEPKTLPLAKL